MDILLELDSTKRKNLIFKFKFINTDFNSKMIPVSEFESSVDRNGLKIVRNEKRMEPAEYMMISLSNPREGDIILKSGEEYEISIIGTIEKTENLGDILKFKHATYLLDAETTYHISLSWKEFLSNVVEWRFHPT